MKSFIRGTVMLYTFMTLTSFAQQLESFDELYKALLKGKEVRAVFHYAQCKMQVDSVFETAPEAVGGMPVNSFEHFAKGVVRNPLAFLTFSETILISHPRHGFIWNYVKCKVFEDNRVEINARYLTLKDYETVMNETFFGRINDGDNKEGVFFFKND